MATKFMFGTELFMYECMMQQTPNMARCEREEKRFKAQYIGLLRDFLREYGYGEISKRVTRTIDRFLFDEFVFCNEEHRDMFWRMYSKWIKNTNEKDFTPMAIIYLLSTHRQFETNKLVPPDYKMTDEDKKAEETGELVFSYGSSKVEIKEIQSVSWKKDDMNYQLLQIDGKLSADELVEMAKEVIGK